MKFNEGKEYNSVREMLTELYDNTDNHDNGLFDIVIFDDE